MLIGCCGVGLCTSELASFYSLSPEWSNLSGGQTKEFLETSSPPPPHPRTVGYFLTCLLKVTIDYTIFQLLDLNQEGGTEGGGGAMGFETAGKTIGIYR
jgi:hypothetical protein